MMLLEQMLQAGQFAEFIDEIGKVMYEEKVHNMRWDFWLHRVYDMTFEEYVELCKQQQPKVFEKHDLGATVKHSYEMMMNFHPE